MPEWRTQQQIDADEQMHRAVIAVQNAYGNDPEIETKFILTEYIVISARVGITDDKVQNTFYDYALSNGSIPWHSMMGLMDWAYMAMKDAMTNSEDG